MNETIRVVIIDNGINKDIYYNLTRRDIKEYIIKDGACIWNEQVTHDNILSHGTVCAAILTNHACNADIISISIADHSNLLISNLETALHWCMQNQIDIISMSIGVTSCLGLNQLFPIFKELEQMGIIVVASGSNDNKMTYPAALSYVVGVRYVEGVTNQMTIIKHPFDGINIEASFHDTDFLNRLREEYQFDYPITNSIVTPYIAAKFSEYIGKGIRKKNLIDYIDDFGRFHNAYFETDRRKIHLPESKIKWMMLQSISIPMVGLIYDKDHIDNMSHLSMLLHKKFCLNEYNSILLSTSIETQVEGNIFQIGEEKIASELFQYYCITVADIMLLHLPHSSLVHNNLAFLDLIIYFNEHEEKHRVKNTLIIPNGFVCDNEQVEFIYKKIIEIYDES